MFRSVEKFVLRNISLWNLLKEAAKYGILKKIVCDLGVRAHKLGKVRRFKMLLPVVFLCNALLFLTVLNSRFRLLAEAIVSGGVFVLSILLNLLLSPAFNDATGQFGNGMNVLLLLVAAVFLYTNNLAQKLSLSLLLISNYAFLLPVTTTLLKALPFAGDGIWSAVIGSLLYIVLTFLSFMTLAHPFRYFAQRGVSVLSVGLCVSLTICLFCANGILPAFFGLNSVTQRLILTAALYLVLAFTVRAAFNAAKYQENACTAEHREQLLGAEADYFRAMVGNVTNAKNAQEHHDFVLHEIAAEAQDGSCEGVLNIIKKETVLHDPYLQRYSENPYVNAVLAGKAAYAAHCGIVLESNVELGAVRLKTIEFCAILNDMLTHAIDCAEHSGAEEPRVRITALPVENRITFEAVYSAQKKQKKRTPATKSSVNDLVHKLFEPKKPQVLGMEVVRGILERYSGAMDLSAAGGSEILRIIINN